MIKTLSASSLSAYKTCPLQFYYTYVLKLKQLPNDAFKIGTALHKCLELFHNGVTIEQIMERMFNELVVNKTKEELEMYGLIRKLLEKYAKNPILDENLETEFKFSYPIKDIPIPLFGYIDRITNKGIIEYKTSSFDYTEEDIDTIQATTYSYAFWRKYKKIPLITFVVFNKKKANKDSYKPQILTIKRSEQDLINFEEHCKDVYNKIINKEFNPCPSLACRWCAYGKNGTGNCKYATK